MINMVTFTTVFILGILFFIVYHFYFISVLDKIEKILINGNASYTISELEDLLTELDSYTNCQYNSKAWVHKVFVANTLTEKINQLKRLQ